MYGLHTYIRTVDLSHGLANLSFLSAMLSCKFEKKEKLNFRDAAVSWSEARKTIRDRLLLSFLFC